MNGRDLLEGMGYVDDSFVDEAETARIGIVRPHWARWASMAACICLITASALFWLDRGGNNPDAAAMDGAAMGQSTETLAVPEYAGHSDEKWVDGETDMEESNVSNVQGVTIPRMEVTLRADRGLSADMMAFFIYQGRSYVQHELLEDGEALVGAYLGTATGMINEWTPEDGYVELAGSVCGDFYAVEGMDPEFMLCMKLDNGVVQTFINDNGLTLTLGAELFEERMHLAGNYSTVEFRPHGEKISAVLDSSDHEVVDRFLAALNDAQFLYSQDVPLTCPETHPSEKSDGTCLYALTFRMESGMSWELLLHRDGYVCFSGLRQVCVQVDGDVFEELLEILEQEGAS